LASGNIPTSVLCPAIGATVWTGLITSAYTIYAQAFGQSRRGVTPTDANLVYTLQPLFTALFAFVLLGETMGPAGVLGGSLIGGAVYLVASNEDLSQDMDDSPSDSCFAEKSFEEIIFEEKLEELTDRKA
jgi:drug/metabolite transporter (DMT)-like permease